MTWCNAAGSSYSVSFVLVRVQSLCARVRSGAQCAQQVALELLLHREREVEVPKLKLTVAHLRAVVVGVGERA